MIQRIQSVYLAIAIILLSIVTCGLELFSFVNEKSRFVFNSFGVSEYSNDSSNELLAHRNFPVFIGLIALILLVFITLMSYKNLNRQFKLGRTVFYLYFVFLITLLILSSFGSKLIDAETSAREMGLGFFLFVAGFPFTFLANTGIKRDKKLIESVDRIR